jgi:hypothetical protein
MPRPCHRSMRSTAAARGAAGRKACAGSLVTTETRNVRDHRCASGARPAAHRAATWVGTTRSADRRRLPGPSSRRSSAVVMANGGLATTAKVRRGSSRSAASASRTTTASPLEAAPQPAGPRRMQLHSHHPGPGGDQMRRQGASTGADVEDQVVGVDTGRPDESASPVIRELVVPPVGPPSGGHDTPSPLSRPKCGGSGLSERAIFVDPRAFCGGSQVPLRRISATSEEVHGRGTQNSQLRAI